MINSLTNMPLLKIFARKGGVRIALRAQRTPPLRKKTASPLVFFSLKSKVLRKNKINKKLSGILYQNYTAVLYHFKTAVDNWKLGALYRLWAGVLIVSSTIRAPLRSPLRKPYLM